MVAVEAGEEALAQQPGALSRLQFLLGRELVGRCKGRTAMRLASAEDPTTSRTIWLALLLLVLVSSVVVVAPQQADAADYCVHTAYSPWKSGTEVKGKTSGYCYGTSYFDERWASLWEGSWPYYARDTWGNTSNVVGYSQSSLHYPCSSGSDNWRVKSVVKIASPTENSTKYSYWIEISC